MAISRQFSDFDFDFLKHPVTNDVLRKNDEKAIIQSLRNLIQTNHFERPFNPRIGSNIEACLFEFVDPITAGIIEKELTLLIMNYEPRVKIDYLQVIGNPDQNGYDVILRFYIVNNTKPSTVSIFLSRLR